MVFFIVTLATLALFVAVLISPKPKRAPARSRAGFLGSLVGAFSDGGKEEALKRQLVGENAIYHYGDQAANRLQDEMNRIEGGLRSEAGFRDMERGRVLREALAQRNMLAPQAALSGIGSGALANFLNNPGQLGAGGQFQMREAARAVGNQAAGQGMRLSGAAMQALQDRAQGIAQSDRASQLNEIMSAIGAGTNAIGMQRYAGPFQDYMGQLLGARSGMATNMANQQMMQGQGIANMANAMAGTITGTTAGKNQMISGGLNMLGGKLLGG